MGFCSSPLRHERETVYNQFLKDMETKVIGDYVGVRENCLWIF